MSSPLRVDPDRLRAAAAAQTDVGCFLSGLGLGRSMTAAGSAMPGLATGEACQVAGTLLDTVAGTVGTDLTAHSERLTAAAEHYRQADDDLGRRLARLTEPA